MRLVVADASPVNYLILIEHINVLAVLYGRVVLPPAVAGELRAARAPDQVREWMKSPPAWIEIRPVPIDSEPLIVHLDAGELEAIQLAYRDPDSLLLIDEHDGRIAARRLGIAWIGTLGILREAAESGEVNLFDAIERLRQTNFRMSESLVKSLLQR